VLGARDGVVERLVPRHQVERDLQIAVGNLALFKRPSPKLALGFGAAAE